MNTASEYGFGGVIAALPGFTGHRRRAQGDSQPARERSDHGDGAGRHHRLGLRRHEHRARRDGRYSSSQRRRRPGFPLEVLHRVASMASGGMDTLPHNGAVITLLAVTGLTHKQSYGDIFAITLIKTAGGVRRDRRLLRTGWSELHG